jgi:hypothetical protein
MRKLIEDQRAVAEAAGRYIYTGSIHARCATSERYTINRACVRCARRRALETRLARERAERAPVAMGATP